MRGKGVGEPHLRCDTAFGLLGPEENPRQANTQTGLPWEVCPRLDPSAESRASEMQEVGGPRTFWRISHVSAVLAELGCSGEKELRLVDQESEKQPGLPPPPRVRRRGGKFRMNFNCEDQGDLEGKTFAFVSDFHTFRLQVPAPQLPTPHRSARAPLMTAGFRGSRLQVRALRGPPAPPGPTPSLPRPRSLGRATRGGNSPSCLWSRRAGPEHTLPPLCASPGWLGARLTPRYYIVFKSYHLCIRFGSFGLLMYLTSPRY